MRLKLYKENAKVHRELAAAVGWNVQNELLSCSDDQTICKWNQNGEPEGKVGWGVGGRSNPTIERATGILPFQTHCVS